MAVPQADAVRARSTEERAANEGRDKVVNVLHVNAGNLYGGVETILVTLANAGHLCPGMQSHFAVCYEGRLSRDLRAAGVPVHVLGPVRMSRPWTVWRARRLFRELFLGERFDLVVCHMSWSLAVFGPTVRAAGQKLAIWSHGFQIGRDWLDRMAGRVMPDGMIANSQFTAARLREQFLEVPQEVIYCPVMAPVASELGAGRSEFRKQLAVEDDTTVIVQVSRMEPWKGHGLLLEALTRIGDAGKWICWIVGGPQRAEEESYLRQLRATSSALGLADRVRFLGQRTDVSKLIAAADIFCQPNLEPEPFGIVFVEALGAGRPVVTTAMGGALEIVDDSCGALTKPGDPDSLAAALRRLIESAEMRARLGRSGIERGRQLCDPAAQLRKLEQVVRTWSRN